VLATKVEANSSDAAKYSAHIFTTLVLTDDPSLYSKRTVEPFSVAGSPPTLVNVLGSSTPMRVAVVEDTLTMRNLLSPLSWFQLKNCVADTGHNREFLRLAVALKFSKEPKVTTVPATAIAITSDILELGSPGVYVIPDSI